MAVCKSCGKEIGDNEVFCSYCGAAQNAQDTRPTGQYQQYQQYQPAPAEPEDKGGFLWGLLGCCIPIVGLILFLVWKDTKPNSAKAAGIGALVSVIVGVVFYILMFVIGMLGAGLAAGY